MSKVERDNTARDNALKVFIVKRRIIDDLGYNEMIQVVTTTEL